MSFLIISYTQISYIYVLCVYIALGDNGTIDGQGSIWWDWFNSHSLNYSRPHLVEFTLSENIVVSNLTFLNAPAYNIHPVYCRYVNTFVPIYTLKHWCLFGY